MAEGALPFIISVLSINHGSRQNLVKIRLEDSDLVAAMLFSITSCIKAHSFLLWTVSIAIQIKQASSLFCLFVPLEDDFSPPSIDCCHGRTTDVILNIHGTASYNSKILIRFLLSHFRSLPSASSPVSWWKVQHVDQVMIGVNFQVQFNRGFHDNDSWALTLLH